MIKINVRTQDDRSWHDERSVKIKDLLLLLGLASSPVSLPSVNTSDPHWDGDFDSFEVYKYFLNPRPNYQCKLLFVLNKTFTPLTMMRIEGRDSTIAHERRFKNELRPVMKDYYGICRY
jgi:hypothetical protein